MATADAAITFNAQGVSWATRMRNNLPEDKRNDQTRAFVVAGQIVDKTQRLAGSSANGIITHIHPQMGKVNDQVALSLRMPLDIIISTNFI